MRDRVKGGMQGFLVLTTFTIWQRFGMRFAISNARPHFAYLSRWFKWDSMSVQAGMRGKNKKSRKTDTTGKIAILLEKQKRSGDPDKEGVIWERIAEVSILGALGCGEWLMRLIIEELTAGDQYDWLILQSAEGAISFYESLGFTRVGAVARYWNKEEHAVEIFSFSSRFCL